MKATNLNSSIKQLKKNKANNTLTKKQLNNVVGGITGDPLTSRGTTTTVQSGDDEL